MKEEPGYSVGRFNFKTEAEYEAALDDVKIINSLKRKGDITNPETAREILKSIEKYPDMFETVVGLDFKKQIRAFAMSGNPVTAAEDDNSSGIREKDLETPAQQNSSRQKRYESGTYNHGYYQPGKYQSEKYRGGSYKYKRGAYGKNASNPYIAGNADKTKSKKNIKGRNGGKSKLRCIAAWFKRLEAKKKVAAVIVFIAACTGIYSAGYEIYYRYQSYLSLKKIQELAACILEPIEPDVSDIHKQMDVYAGSSGWDLPYVIIYPEPKTELNSENKENISETQKKHSDKKIYYLMTDINYDIPADTQPEILYQYSILYERNNDMVGWISIDGTAINYPVMQCMTDEEYYLKRDFDKGSDINGLPFMDTECSILKPTANFLIYGHNMRNGSMFAGLLQYEKKEFYDEHKIIRFDTVYEQAEYEIVAVFRSHIAYKNEDVFKYYKFFDAQTVKEYNDYISNIKKLSFYDTGITPQYGEQLLTLSTCDRSIEDGRFVVVARKCK